MRIAAVGDLHCRADTRRNIAVALRGVDQEAEALAPGRRSDRPRHHRARRTGSPRSWRRSRWRSAPCWGTTTTSRGRRPRSARSSASPACTSSTGSRGTSNDLGVAGVKGFAGGFDQAQLQRFGEEPLKAFVDACIAEELKLEKALFQLRTRHRIALLHYSPCRQTLEGEPLEIFPFLGATRLSGPLDQLRPASPSTAMRTAARCAAPPAAACPSTTSRCPSAPAGEAARLPDRRRLTVRAAAAPPRWSCTGR